MEYVAPIRLPDLFKSTKTLEEQLTIMNSEVPSQLNVFPNPSKGYIIIEYHLDIEKTGIIDIRDINGVVIEQVVTNKLQDQVTFLTHDWKPGSYIATLKIGGRLMESCKFTLLR
ncbi:MAG: T9SS type A sorting domain-containing protein [Bacteroidetes bacterium]|nr:T9SS type A sorting domain-containing protein [Bacteroidota bacterium]